MGTQPVASSFAIIFVLGAPGGGKGTLCQSLAESHNLAHYSVGDGLRAWMRENRTTPLALQIQDKLDNQGFLTSKDLNPFICQAIPDAYTQNEPKPAGILIDGFPRCIEQLESWTTWPFQEKLPLTSSSLAGGADAAAKPDVVLSLRIAKETAKARYVARARDKNDQAEKFDKRFAEYERETVPVEEMYRQRGILIDIDANGTKDENADGMMKKLEESEVWQKVVLEGRMEASLLF